ncbi:hypothetical protein OG216_35390 [Streptomycetaceae bacterium NBC_01309]
MPLATTLLAVRSLARFDGLADRTGITFARPVESVAVMPETIDDPELRAWFDPGRFEANARDLGRHIEPLDTAELADA